MRREPMNTVIEMRSSVWARCTWQGYMKWTRYWHLWVLYDERSCNRYRWIKTAGKSIFHALQQAPTWTNIITQCPGLNYEYAGLDEFRKLWYYTDPMRTIPIKRHPNMKGRSSDLRLGSWPKHSWCVLRTKARLKLKNSWFQFLTRAELRLRCFTVFNHLC